MGLLKYNNVGIRVLSATVPSNVVTTRSLTEYFSKDEIERFIKATGVEERRFIDEKLCASDLCYKSACEIFEKTSITKDEIDILIFISQTPDYKSPGTSIILQNRLGLNKNTIVYDVNMSCSGFIHGLMMGYSFLMNPDVNNVLLMVGDTLSKMISLQDKSTGLLLGDAGVAAILGKGNQYETSYFSMNTDGDYVDYVKIPAGGCRMMSSPDTLKMQKYDDGSVRNLEQAVMIGTDVFSFAISELPRDIKKLLNYAEKSIDDVDLYAFHQANNFMTNFVAKKAKANSDKILRSIQKFGNTAGTSIPLCMVANKGKIRANNTVLMNAIGAGFAYGTVLLNIGDCEILELSEL